MTDPSIATQYMLAYLAFNPHWRKP